jgi:hypothetical protein
VTHDGRRRGIYVVEMFEWDEHLQRELDLGGACSIEVNTDNRHIGTAFLDARLTVAGRQRDTTASVRQDQVS